LPELTQLKRVDLPTFGRPTIPHLRLIENAGRLLCRLRDAKIAIIL